jgi:hypothetical protein
MALRSKSIGGKRGRRNFSVISDERDPSFPRCRLFNFRPNEAARTLRWSFSLSPNEDSALRVLQDQAVSSRCTGRWVKLRRKAEREAFAHKSEFP